MLRRAYIFPLFQGLIPRAKLLLTIGGAFFLGFWPLILIIVASFSALYSVSYLSATLLSVICYHGSLPIQSALLCPNWCCIRLRCFYFLKIDCAVDQCQFRYHYFYTDMLFSYLRYAFWWKVIKLCGVLRFEIWKWLLSYNVFLFGLCVCILVLQVAIIMIIYRNRLAMRSDSVYIHKQER